MHVALAACAAARNDRPLARHHEVGKHFAAVLVENHRARRHAHHHIAAGMAVLLLAAPGFSVARDQTRVVFEIEQSRETLVNLENHVAAAPAVAPGGAAEGTILLAQERDRAVTPLAGRHEDPRFIDELHRTSLLMPRATPHNCYRSSSARARRASAWRVPISIVLTGDAFQASTRSAIRSRG